MRLKNLFVTGLAMLLSGLAFAQGAAPANDPVTGKWVGYGAIANGTVAGRVTVNGQPGVFKLARKASGATTQAQADPMTGKWTGYLGRSATDTTPVVIDFKFDGKTLTGTVTGPQLTPGEVQDGTFDPKTGALKFVTVVRSDGNKVAFDGTVTGGTAAGRLTMNGTTGVFKVAKGGAAAARPAAGAAAAPPASVIDATANARRSFTEVSGWVARAADLVPADKYGYRPVSTVRTFGQLVGHVADSYLYYCGRAAGKNVQWTDAIEKGTPDKAALIQRFKQALDACNTAYAANGQIGPLTDNVGHTNLHYGNMVTYMRMLGLTPPSS